MAGGQAPGCIGSSNGSECFQGGIDELRIYRDALTAEENLRFYAALYGLDEIDRRVLEAIIHKYHGGPVGLSTIGASISVFSQRRARETRGCAPRVRRPVRRAVQRDQLAAKGFG